MKISFIKYEKQENFEIPKILGMHIEEIKEPEEVDKKIQELKNKEYTTKIITNQQPTFSTQKKIKYQHDSINIIITPSK